MVESDSTIDGQKSLWTHTGVRLDQLSPRQKDVYILHRKEGKSLKEVSQELNISFHTVKNHLAEARKNLRELIDPDVMYIIMVISMVEIIETVY